MTTLDFGEKVKVICYAKNGFTLDLISEMHNTTVDKIIQILGSEQRIMDVYQSSYLKRALQMPLKRGLYPYMENLLYSWYSEQQNRVTNKALTEKAKEFLELLNEQPTTKNFPKFTGSNGWVNGFKERFDIPIFRRKTSLSSVNIATLDLSTEPIVDERIDNLNDHQPNGNQDESTASSDKEKEDLFYTTNDFTAEPELSPNDNLFANKSSSGEEEDLLYTEFTAESEFKSNDNQFAGKASSGGEEDLLYTINEYNAELELNISDHNGKQSESSGSSIEEDHFYKTNESMVELDSSDLNGYIPTKLSDDVRCDDDIETNGIINLTETLDTLDNTDMQPADETEADNLGQEETAQALINCHRRTRKRTRPLVLHSTDNSSSDNDSDSGQKEKRKRSEEILVSTKSGIKTMNLSDFMEKKVISMFKPLFKFSKDNAWPEEDSEQLERLYRKSLKSCQLTLTQFFRKKK